MAAAGGLGPGRTAPPRTAFGQAGLCRVLLPRPVRDAVDYVHVTEITDAMALEHDAFTADQRDYFDLLCALLEGYDREHVRWPWHPIPRTAPRLPKWPSSQPRPVRLPPRPELADPSRRAASRPGQVARCSNRRSSRPAANLGPGETTGKPGQSAPLAGRWQLAGEPRGGRLGRSCFRRSRPPTHSSARNPARLPLISWSYLSPPFKWLQLLRSAPPTTVPPFAPQTITGWLAKSAIGEPSRFRRKRRRPLQTNPEKPATSRAT